MKKLELEFHASKKCKKHKTKLINVIKYNTQIILELSLNV